VKIIANHDVFDSRVPQKKVQEYKAQEYEIYWAKFPTMHRGYQARVGSIWREVLYAIVVLTAIKGEDHLVARYVRGLLWGLREVPIAEKDGKVT
jgi:hypothetical protein